MKKLFVLKEFGNKEKGFFTEYLIIRKKNVKEYIDDYEATICFSIDDCLTEKEVNDYFKSKNKNCDIKDIKSYENEDLMIVYNSGEHIIGDKMGRYQELFLNTKQIIDDINNRESFYKNSLMN